MRHFFDSQAVLFRPSSQHSQQSWYTIHRQYKSRGCLELHRGMYFSGSRLLTHACSAIEKRPWPEHKVAPPNVAGLCPWQLAEEFAVRENGRYKQQQSGVHECQMALAEITLGRWSHYQDRSRQRCRFDEHRRTVRKRRYQRSVEREFGWCEDLRASSLLERNVALCRVCWQASRPVRARDVDRNRVIEYDPATSYFKYASSAYIFGRRICHPHVSLAIDSIP